MLRKSSHFWRHSLWKWLFYWQKKSVIGGRGIEDRLTWCLEWIDKIRSDMSKLNSLRAEDLKFVNADPSIVSYVEGRSKLTTTDSRDMIETIKPDLLEIFAGGDDVVSVQPQEETDTEGVKRQEILVNKQLKIRNQWYITCNDVISDALELKTGGAKITWHKETKYIDKTYEGLTDEEFIAKINQPDTEVLEHTEVITQQAEIDPLTGMTLSPAIKEHTLKLRYVINDEYPKIEPIPAEKLGFPINAKDIQDAPFMYHICTYPKWEFMKVFNKKAKDIEKYISSYPESDTGGVEQQRFAEFGKPTFMYDKDSQEYIVYECYYREPDTGDWKITHICGKEELLTEDNSYGKYPFRIATPVKLSHRIIGLSIPDLLKEIQKARTALFRQIYDNAYLANSRRYFLDPSRLNLDDYLNNTATNSVIRCKGDPRGIVLPEEKAPLPPEIFSFWEMLNVEKDYHGITPRSYQGVNPNVLNKTFRGQNQQIAQAGKRLMMMARLFAEMFFKPLVCDVIDLNLKFLTKKTQVRYLNDWIEISPDNIVGKYDVVVNVGLGTGSKDQTIVYMQQLMGLYAQIYKAGIPIVNGQNVHNAMKELVKAMGFQNTSDFVSDPKLNQAITQFAMAVLQKMQMSGIQDPETEAMAMQILSLFGAAPQQQGNISGKDTEMTETPSQPHVAGQPFNPMLTPSGRGYYA